MVLRDKDVKLPEETKTKHDAILEELANESGTVLSLAYAYAKGYEMCGEDITQRWANVQLQTDALNRAYAKGFKDGVQYVIKKQ